MKVMLMSEIERSFPKMIEVLYTGYQAGEMCQMCDRQDFYLPENAPDGAYPSMVHGHPSVKKFLHHRDGSVEEVESTHTSLYR